MSSIQIDFANIWMVLIRVKPYSKIFLDSTYQVELLSNGIMQKNIVYYNSTSEMFPWKITH